MHGVAWRWMCWQFDIKAPDMTAVTEQVALEGVTTMAFLIIELQATVLEERETSQISE